MSMQVWEKFSNLTEENTMAVKNIQITRQNFYDWGGFSNRQLFRRTSPDGVTRYYRIDKS